MGKKTPGFLNNSQSTPKTVKRFPREAPCTPEARHRTQRRNAFHARCPRKYTEWSVSWGEETRPYNPMVGLGATFSGTHSHPHRSLKMAFQSCDDVVISGINLVTKPPHFPNSFQLKENHMGTFTSHLHWRFLFFMSFLTKSMTP